MNAVLVLSRLFGGFSMVVYFGDWTRVAMVCALGLFVGVLVGVGATFWLRHIQIP